MPASNTSLRLSVISLSLIKNLSSSTVGSIISQDYESSGCWDQRSMMTFHPQPIRFNETHHFSYIRQSSLWLGFSDGIVFVKRTGSSYCFQLNLMTFSNNAQSFLLQDFTNKSHENLIYFFDLYFDTLRKRTSGSKSLLYRFKAIQFPMRYFFWLRKTKEWKIYVMDEPNFFALKLKKKSFLDQELGNYIWLN